MKLAGEEFEADEIMSLPMRGEWIEIVLEVKRPTAACVSPHAGRVD